MEMEGRKFSRKSVHGEMICGICFSLLKEPKVFACAHSFCKCCLSKLHQTKSKSPVELQVQDLIVDNHCDENEEHSTNNKVECPTCLQITVLPDECSIDSLKTQKHIEDAIASLDPEEKEAIQDKIGNQRKVIADITDGNGEFRAEWCMLHKKQQLYFCIDCNILACIDCVEDPHSSHNCGEISSLLVDTFSQLHSLVQPACEYMSRADTSIQKLVQDFESIESNRNMCKEAVLGVFDALRRAVDEREKKLLNSIDTYVDKKLSHVVHQRKNLVEVQDQLYQSIQEVQQMLDSTPFDIALVMDKQCLIDDVDEQEQNILDLENSVTNSMFSSTYIGFRDDDTQTLTEQLDTLITLCELYPDADTGYYSSRIIAFENEEDLYMETKSQENILVSSERRRPSACTTIVENESVEIFPDFQEEITSAHKPQISSLKRSKSSPSVSTKEMWLIKMRTSAGSISIDERNPPSIPIRFDSLLLPTPILKPKAVFNRLTVSKLETVYPCGICVGENNSFIISDVKNHCLRIIANNGKFIGAIGKEGKGSGQFEEPCAVAINEKAQIIICQRENPRVQKLTSGGKYIQKFGHKSFRSNSLGEPWGVAVGPDKKIYVTDWDKSCIHIFHSNGRYDHTIGSDDSMLGESLKFPAGLAVDTNGNIIVADRGNHCVWVLNTEGSILTCIGSKGHGPGELFLPHGIAIHPNGSIVVSESGNNRISIFSQSGKFLKHFGRKGNEPGMFEHPRHVCVTTKGEIVVADELNQRLQLFQI